MTAVQLFLPLEAAPPKVRAHGLRDAHERPLVSRGKRRDGSFPGSFRVSPQDAWHYPSLELRAGNSWPCLIQDCDGGEGTARLVEAYMAGEAPTPNWIVTRYSSGGSHAVWNLAAPVHRGEAAREAPLRLFARVAERLAEVIGADAGYAGVLTHNPMARAQGNDLRTVWLERDPYELREIAAKIIPFGWRLPAMRRTEIGRNDDLFRAGMTWAGSPANLGYPVLPMLLALNQRFDHPLDEAEVAGIARSVERYRTRWIAEGRFYTPEERTAWGQAGGIKGGVARRKAEKERDDAIVAAVLGGQSMRSVAKAHGLALSTVQHIMRRDAPLLVPSDPSLEEARPWEAEGVSRRTWYRHQQTPAKKLNDGS